MISNTSTHRLEDRGVRGGRRTPQSSGALRKDVRARKALGFTLIEVMIVVVVLSIVATIAFVGIGQNRFEGKYREFTGEIIGLITTARNRAIDDQTLVQVRVYEDKVLVFDQDPTDKQWRELRSIKRDEIAGNILGNKACIYGFYSGVQVPSQALDVVVPNACLNTLQILEFQPDGNFVFIGDDTLGGANGTGTTLDLADLRTAQVRHTLIEIFPGGLIRDREVVD